MRNLLPLIFLATVGCSVSTEYSVSFRIEGEMLEWAEAFSKGVEVWHTVGAQLVIDEASPRGVRCASWDMGTAAAATNSAGISVDCLYLYGLPEEKRVNLFAHEFGHVLGLTHIDDLSAVMYPEVTNIVTLSRADLDQYNGLYPGGY